MTKERIYAVNSLNREISSLKQAHYAQSETKTEEKLSCHDSDSRYKRAQFFNWEKIRKTLSKIGCAACKWLGQHYRLTQS
jgi:hypothetical protein